jgi:hypothetical protein
VTGHRVVAELELLASECGGLKGGAEEGNKSLIFVFEGFEDEDAGDGKARFGAVIDRIRSGCGQPGCSMEAELWFWIELAAIYATPGVTFDLWYAGRTVGHGKVVAVCDELLGDVTT